MGDAGGIVNRAIDWIDYPAELRVLGAGRAFLAEQRNLRKCPVQFCPYQLLAADIEFQFDVVRCFSVDLLGSTQVLSHELAGGLGGFYGSLL
jgi:hypothetical protein